MCCRAFWIEMLNFRCTVLLFGPWAHKVPGPGPGSRAQVAHGPGPVLGLGRGALQVPALSLRSQAQVAYRPGHMVARAQNIYSNSRSTAIGRLYS